MTENTEPQAKPTDTALRFTTPPKHASDERVSDLHRSACTTISARAQGVHRALDGTPLALAGKNIAEGVDTITKALDALDDVAVKYDPTDFGSEYGHLPPAALAARLANDLRPHGDTIANVTGVLTDVVRAALAQADQAVLPSADVSNYERTRDAVSMLLDSTLKDPNHAKTLETALTLIDEAGPTDENDVAGLLVSEWGRAYFRANGRQGTYEALLSSLRARAASRGGESQKQAAKAREALKEHAASVLAVRDVAAQRAKRHGLNPFAPSAPSAVDPRSAIRPGSEHSLGGTGSDGLILS